MMILSKRFIRNMAIGIVMGLTIMSLIIGLLMQAPWKILLLSIAITTLASIIGVVIGWLLLRMMYPQLRNKKETISYVNTKISLRERKEMNVEYKLNADDVLDFNLYNYEHSPKLERPRKLIRRMLLVAFAVELIVAIVVAALLGSEFMIIAIILGVMALLTLVWYFVSPLYIRKVLTHSVRQEYSQGKDRLTGKHKLTITPDAVTDITDTGESTTRWSAVEWVASTNRYLFIMVRGSGPHIVPGRAFTGEATFNQFVDTAKAFHQMANRS